MSIPTEIAQRFQGLIASVLQGRLMLVACTNKHDGSTAYVLSVPDDSGDLHPWGEIKGGIFAMSTYEDPDLAHVLAMAPIPVSANDVPVKDISDDGLPIDPALKKFFMPGDRT